MGRIKRGYTKPFSAGRIGEEQRRAKARKQALRWHIAQGNFDRVDQLLEKWRNK